MRSAAEQKGAQDMIRAMLAKAQQKTRIQLTVEKLKKMICAARGGHPDNLVPMGTEGDEALEAEWTLVKDEDVSQFINFANIFLYSGNCVIEVVDVEPASRLIQVIE